MALRVYKVDYAGKKDIREWPECFFEDLVLDMKMCYLLDGTKQLYDSNNDHKNKTYDVFLVEYRKHFDGYKNWEQRMINILSPNHLNVLEITSFVNEKGHTEHINFIVEITDRFMQSISDNDIFEALHRTSITFKPSFLDYHAGHYDLRIHQKSLFDFPPYQLVQSPEEREQINQLNAISQTFLKRFNCLSLFQATVKWSTGMHINNAVPHWTPSLKFTALTNESDIQNVRHRLGFIYLLFGISKKTKSLSLLPADLIYFLSSFLLF